MSFLDYLRGALRTGIEYRIVGTTTVRIMRRDIYEGDQERDVTELVDVPAISAALLVQKPRRTWWQGGKVLYGEPARVAHRSYRAGLARKRESDAARVQSLVEEAARTSTTG